MRKLRGIMVICDKHKMCSCAPCGHKIPHESAPRGVFTKKKYIGYEKPGPSRVWESPIMPEDKLTCSNAIFFCYYLWERVTCIPIEDDSCGVCDGIW